MARGAQFPIPLDASGGREDGVARAFRVQPAHRPQEPVRPRRRGTRWTETAEQRHRLRKRVEQKRSTDAPCNSVAFTIRSSFAGIARRSFLACPLGSGARGRLAAAAAVQVSRAGGQRGNRMHFPATCNAGLRSKPTTAIEATRPSRSRPRRAEYHTRIAASLTERPPADGCGRGGWRQPGSGGNAISTGRFDAFNNKGPDSSCLRARALQCRK